MSIGWQSRRLAERTQLKQRAFKLFESDEKPTIVAERLGIADSTMREWLREYREEKAKRDDNAKADPNS